MKVAFGRVQLPHLGHKYLIDRCDQFILSSGKKNLSSEIRIRILKELGIDERKLIVGNPFREISRLVNDNPGKIEILYSKENYSLVKNFSGKAKLTEIKRKYGMSSTKLREMIKRESPELDKYDPSYIKLIKEAYEKFWV